MPAATESIAAETMRFGSGELCQLAHTAQHTAFIDYLLATRQLFIYLLLFVYCTTVSESMNY